MRVLRVALGFVCYGLSGSLILSLIVLSFTSFEPFWGYWIFFGVLILLAGVSFLMGAVCFQFKQSRQHLGWVLVVSLSVVLLNIFVWLCIYWAPEYRDLMPAPEQMLDTFGAFGRGITVMFFVMLCAFWLLQAPKAQIQEESAINEAINNE